MNSIVITHTDEHGKKTSLKHQYQGPTNAWAIKAFLELAQQKLYTQIVVNNDKNKQRETGNER